MGSNVTVSVVTPTLNGIQYFKECIESVRMQASPNFTVEHVIVDGGSTDGTVELAESYGLRVMTGKDSGIFDAINKGSFNSSGELIGFLGADDVLLPGGLEEVVKHYHRSTRPWLVGGGRWIDAQGKSLGAMAAPPSWLSAKMLASLGWCCIQHVSIYVSRPFFEELQGFDVSYRAAGEYDMWCRALLRAPYEPIPRTIACFRLTGENFSLREEPGRRERTLVRERYAPQSSLQLYFYRYLMKLWLNSTNLGWAAHKVAVRLRPRERRPTAARP